MHNPFSKPRPNPKRAKERRVRGRVRLKGKALVILRRNKATEAREHCQTCGDYAPIWTEPFEHNGKMVYHGELSHKRHSANKSDTTEETLWECRTCHRKRHNAGGKPVARKPGRLMNQTEALAYWKSTQCFCGGVKPKCGSFCLECLAKLGPQLRFDVQNAMREEYLQSLALAEKELLAWKPRQEQSA